MNNNECHPFLSLSLSCAHGRFYRNNQLPLALRTFNNSTAVPLPPSTVVPLPPSTAVPPPPSTAVLSLPSHVSSRRRIHPPPPSCDSLAFNFDEKSFRYLLSNFFWQNCTRPAKVFLRYFGSRDRVIARYPSRSLASIPPSPPTIMLLLVSAESQQKTRNVNVR